MGSIDEPHSCLDIQTGLSTSRLLRPLVLWDELGVKKKNNDGAL